MRNVFTVRRYNSKGEELSKETAQRLSDLGFTECEEGYFIDLQKLDTKYRMRKPSDKWEYSRNESLEAA